jgi:translocation and assembly module TamB
MRLKSRKFKRLGLVALFLVAAFFAVRHWVVPAIIAQQIRAQYHGDVVIGDWWFGWRSSGVSGVKLRETTSSDSPTWFAADRISTDVSLSRLLHGRVMPTRIDIDRPSVDFRIDAKGQPVTKIPVGSPGDDKARDRASTVKLPEIFATAGEITLAQAGRKPMTIRGVNARLSPVSDGSKLDVKTDDPAWGQVAITGHFDPAFKNSVFEIASSPGFVADSRKLDQIPFIPAEVWANIQPRGPVDAKVRITLAAESPKPVSVHTDLTLKGTDARLNSLQVEAAGATGHVVIDDAMVNIENLQGKTIDGTIGVNGTLDFGGKVPVFDLDILLKGVDVTKAPASWQLGEVGATGRLSGRVDLKVALEPSGPDLTGTTGRAVIEDGSFKGIPIRSLSLGLQADGNDLQYETLPEGSVDKHQLEASRSHRPAPVKQPDPLRASLPLLGLASHAPGMLGWASFLAKKAIAFQASHSSGSHSGGIRLPRTITTRIELEDVELVTIVEKAKKLGIEVPFPVVGRLSINATATIPLGALSDIKSYVFKGDATLKAASIDHVDLGLVLVHIDLADGVLNLSDFRGQLVDHPSGGANNPPRTTAVPPLAGPLAPGGFRANVHAAISPRGEASAHFEGDQLPLGELFAPVLPHPTPLAGEATLRIDASCDLGRISDTKTWSVKGQVDSRRIKYLDAVLDQVASKVNVQDGRVEVTDFTARLLGKPLNARGHIEIAPPYHYGGAVTIEGWELAEVLKLVQGVPSSPPISGVLDAKGEASGTIQPFDISTKGAARVLGASAATAPIGNLGFQWTTDAEGVSITGLELFAFGGKTTGEATIPTRAGKPIQAKADLKGIDAAKLSAAFLGKSLVLTGKADGKVEITMPMDASTIDGHASLTSPDLTVRETAGPSMAVKSLLVHAVAREGVLDYDATAESLGGKVRFHGSAPIVGDLSRAVAEGEILAVGFRMGELWQAFGISNSLSHLDGLGAFDANIRAPIRPFQLAGRGQFELRELHYGKMPALGNLKGIASLTPTSWRVDQLKGEVLGGSASGEAHGQTTPGGSKEIAFDCRVDHASLAKLTKAFPSITHDLEGFGSIRVSGKVSDEIRANAEVLVPRAKMMGLPITDLRMPVELEMNPARGNGSIHSRNWSARVAGGSVRGSAWNRFGLDHSFHSEMHLNGVDLEALSKLHLTGNKAANGKISGKISFQGPNAEHIEKIRGRVDLDLDDASLFEVPMFKELDRFLGSSGGGLFDDGDVHGTIYNRTLFLEQMTLSGRLVQMHATGSITFNGGLNLEILVSTNSSFTQPQLAILNAIPVLGQALGRSEQALRRVASVLESSLLRFRVTGTTSKPNVQLDPGVAIGSAAVGFFSSVLKPGR